jgi:hypothetical protein
MNPIPSNKEPLRPGQASVFEQVVEFGSAIILGFGLDPRDTARSFDDVSYLEEVAEIGLFLVGDIAVDVFAALKPAVGVEMPAATAATQIRPTVRTAF